MSVADASLTFREGSSHRQTRILLVAGFGGLLVLMGVLGLRAISFLYQIEIREERIRRDYVSRDRALETLRSNIYVSGTNLRDFLLDTDENMAATHRKQFLRTRSGIEEELSDYQAYLPRFGRAPLEDLRNELASYFAASTPVLAWDSKGRALRGYRFMQEQVLPHRMIALGLADRIQQVSEKQLETSSEAVTALLASFRTNLLVLLVLTVAIGFAWAGTALWRVLRLERQSLERFREILHARGELKRLSGELVAAQENERRRISRELHDEVGQVLSAIVLGLGNLRSALRDNNMEESFRQLQLVQDMTEKNAGVVRNISLLLRPTMLDDLGLVPALKWLAREVSRNSALSVDVMAEPFPDDLPEEHRTCIFRVVQEALRNASRHSGARHAGIGIQESGRSVSVSVHDDGKGFAASMETGLGILGMQERVMRLGGELRVESEPGRGTIVSFTLPLPEKMECRQDWETRPMRTV